jgi:hypothetical protein
MPDWDPEFTLQAFERAIAAVSLSMAALAALIAFLAAYFIVRECMAGSKERKSLTLHRAGTRRTAEAALSRLRIPLRISRMQRPRPATVSQIGIVSDV